MKKRALLSVADKRGLPDFARALANHGYEIVSSGGTAGALESEGVPVTRVSDVTGFPEIMDGRIKTLHPNVHAGILARREVEADLAELDKHGIAAIDVVAVNFYPFEATVAAGKPLPEIIENIDIGGPSMLRAAAKNFKDVLPVVDPDDYGVIIDALESGVDVGTRARLAMKAFRATARYEHAISELLTRVSSRDGELALEEAPKFPERLVLGYERVQELRYGENPHQGAAFYRSDGIGLAGAEKHHGKELSYNNILDLDAAWRLLRELPNERAAAVVIKHTNPAGAALGDTLVDAYTRARATDPTSAFGGIVALNRPVDASTAGELVSTFLEAVVAPGFDPDALETLKTKKNLRLMSIGDDGVPFDGRNVCRVLGGLLVQDWDTEGTDEAFEPVTERKPSDAELSALRLAWIAAKHVKSNAIVLAKNDALVGVGAGQMSRVDSCRIAVEKAESSLEGAVAASDAFFPFRDGVDALADAGIVAVVQPGGSVRDEEVIAAANERGVAMVFTGRRHFRH